MKWLHLIFWLFVQAATAAFLLSGPQQPQQSPQQQEAPAAPLPRVVGQTRTPEERQAWSAVAEAPAASKPESAKQFLQNFPDSGMTSHAHWMIARDAFQKGDYASFTMHGEATIKELPQALDVLSQLSFYYAETRQYDQAFAHGRNLLSMVENLPKPQNLTPAQFARTRDQIAGQGNYALGRSELGQFKVDSEAEQGNSLLAQAIGHLGQAITHNPTDDYAYFRLGEAYESRQDLDQAGQNYALAAAVGGPVAGPARNSLQTLFQELKKDASQMEALIEQQRSVLQTKVQNKEQEYQKAGPPQEPPG